MQCTLAHEPSLAAVAVSKGALEAVQQAMRVHKQRPTVLKARAAPAHTACVASRASVAHARGRPAPRCWRMAAWRRPANNHL